MIKRNSTRKGQSINVEIIFGPVATPFYNTISYKVRTKKLHLLVSIPCYILSNVDILLGVAVFVMCPRTLRCRLYNRRSWLMFIFKATEPQEIVCQWLITIRCPICCCLVLYYVLAVIHQDQIVITSNDCICDVWPAKLSGNIWLYPKQVSPLHQTHYPDFVSRIQLVILSVQPPTQTCNDTDKLDALHNAI